MAKKHPKRSSLFDKPKPAAKKTPKNPFSAYDTTKMEKQLGIEPEAKAKTKTKAKVKAKPKAKPTYTTSSLVRGVARTVGGVGIGLALGGIVQTAAERQGLPKPGSPGAARNVAAAARIKKNQAAAVAERNKLKGNQQKADAAKPPTQTSSGRAIESGKGIVKAAQEKQKEVAKPKRKNVWEAMVESFLGSDKRTTSSVVAKKKRAVDTARPDAPIAKNTVPKAKRDVSKYSDMKKTKPTRGQGPSAQPFAQRKGDFPNIKDPKQMSTRGAKPKGTPVKKIDKEAATQKKYPETPFVSNYGRSNEYVGSGTKTEEGRRAVAEAAKVKPVKKPSTFNKVFDWVVGRDEGTKAIRRNISRDGSKSRIDKEGGGNLQRKQPVNKTREAEKTAVDATKEEEVNVAKTNFINFPRQDTGPFGGMELGVSRKPKKTLRSAFKTESIHHSQTTPSSKIPKATPRLNPRQTIKAQTLDAKLKQGSSPESWDKSDMGIEDKFGKQMSKWFGSYSAHSGVEGTSSWHERKYEKGKRTQ